MKLKKIRGNFANAYGWYQTKKEILKCDHCGVLFARWRANVKAREAAGLKRHFCGRECAAAGHAKPRQVTP